MLWNVGGASLLGVGLWDHCLGRGGAPSGNTVTKVKLRNLL